MHDDETWLPIPSQPALVASSWGRVHRIIRAPGRGMRPMPTFGRVTHGKLADGSRHTRLNVLYRGLGKFQVSRLVAEGFHGPAPFPGAVVMHLDDDALNNRPENLAWGTQGQNLNAPAHRAFRRRLAATREIFRDDLGRITGHQAAA